MAENDEQYFTCHWCHKPLAATEVVPLFSEGCCGFAAACVDCAAEQANKTAG